MMPGMAGLFILCAYQDFRVSKNQLAGSSEVGVTGVGACASLVKRKSVSSRLPALGTELLQACAYAGKVECVF